MEFVDFGRFFWSFAFVLGLLGLLALLMRRYGSSALRIKPKSEARVEILETLPLDSRFRLLLIRRDDVEHLIVKGPETVQVIETGIPHREIVKQSLEQEEPHDDETA